MKHLESVSAIVVFVVLFCVFRVGGKTVTSIDDDDDGGGQPIRVDLDLSHVVRVVSDRFLSVAIDASLMSEEKFMNLLK